MSKTQIELAPPSQISKTGNYLTVEEIGVSYAYSLGRVFFLVAKFIWLLFLLALLIVTFVVWIWIVSFRTGWNLWEWKWANRSKTDGHIAAGVGYGFIISLVSPFVLFFNWAQELLKEAKLLPKSFPMSQIDLLKIVEKNLQIELGSQFPCLVESKEKSPAETSSSSR